MAVAVPLVFGGGAPAYAITRNADGTIQISINEAKNPKALQADLEKMGLRAVVDFIPNGKRCSPQPRSASWVPREEAKLTVFPPTEGSDFTIDPAAVKEGQTAVLEFGFNQNDGWAVAGVWSGISNGPVAECTLVDSPGAPPGPGPRLGLLSLMRLSFMLVTSMRVCDGGLHRPTARARAPAAAF